MSYIFCLSLLPYRPQLHECQHPAHEEACSSTAVIMWTNTHLTDLRGLFPNQFVPLLPKDLVAQSSKTYSQGTADDKLANLKKGTHVFCKEGNRKYV